MVLVMRVVSMLSAVAAMIYAFANDYSHATYNVGFAILLHLWAVDRQAKQL